MRAPGLQLEQHCQNGFMWELWEPPGSPKRKRTWSPSTSKAPIPAMGLLHSPSALHSPSPFWCWSLTQSSGYSGEFCHHSHPSWGLLHPIPPIPPPPENGYWWTALRGHQLVVVVGWRTSTNSTALALPLLSGCRKRALCTFMIWKQCWAAAWCYKPIGLGSGYIFSWIFFVINMILIRTKEKCDSHPKKAVLKLRKKDLMSRNVQYFNLLWAR